MAFFGDLTRGREPAKLVSHSKQPIQKVQRMNDDHNVIVGYHIVRYVLYKSLHGDETVVWEFGSSIKE